MSVFKHIRDLLKKNIFKYIAGIFCLLFVDFLQLVLPKILGDVIDRLRSLTISHADLARYAMIITLISLGMALFRLIWRYLIFGTAKKIDAELRERLYGHLQSLSTNYYNNHKTGDLMAHATNDLKNVEMATGQAFALAVDSSLIPLVALGMMIRTAGLPLTLACFSPMLLLAVFIAINSKLAYDKIQKMQEAFSTLTEKVRENISGIRVIKAFAQEDLELKEFEKINRNNMVTNLKYAKSLQILFPVVMSISALTTAIALLYGGLLVVNGKLTLGSFIAFNSYLLLLIWPIAAIGWVSTLFQRGFVSLKRINAILDEVPDIKNVGADHGLVTSSQISGDIEINSVSFTYPGSLIPALSDINIAITSGKTLAIAGRTGSGKTTLANLILRLYDVSSGTIKIDGIEIDNIPLEKLRGNIGCVPQDTFLFSSTIKENIGFFGGNDFKSIESAAKASMVYDNIIGFPAGFETMVGERGVTLSGGQKQRIAIARAIIRNPSILILDDCLSAVDTHTEEAILKELKQVMENRTSIIISHRMSTIKDADEIVVLDKGHIVERGTHEELISLDGIYHELYQKQLLADQIEGVE